MSLSSLIPANTLKAHTTALGAFTHFLKAEDVGEDYVHASILSDASGARLAALLDRFGLHLAFSKGKDGKLLAKHSVMSNFRNAMQWLLESYPLQRAAVETELLRKGKTLEKHCLKREEGGLVDKVPACTKSDLFILLETMYQEAACSKGYQDAALLCLMWHYFGRASDLGFVQKRHVSLAADGAVFLRLLRVKTSQEQGLTLVPDRASFVTCPVFAIAAALAAQDTPTHALLSQLPALLSPAAIVVDATVPLHNLLEADPNDLVSAGSQSTKANKVKAEVGIHGYINRLLRRANLPSEATRDLASHSFRRGGAQHANREEKLASQWILDRGAWNMSSANKGFAYVFNTPREDRKVARVLSGWAPDDAPSAVDPPKLDSATRSQLARLQMRIFSSCSGIEDPRLNADTRVLETLAATLVLHYPQLKSLSADAPLVRRLEGCSLDATGDPTQLLSLANALQVCAHGAVTKTRSNEPTPVDQTRERDAAIIRELIAMNRALSDRMRVCESALIRLTAANTTAQAQPRHRDDEDHAELEEPAAKRRKKAAPSNLTTVWYKWYTKVPRIWNSDDRQSKPDSRLLAAYLKLFIPNGFTLVEDAPRFKDDVLALGAAAQEATLAFLRGRGITAEGAGSVLKSLRKLHREGALNDRIEAYRRLLKGNSIIDPAPLASQDILAPAGTLGL